MQNPDVNQVFELSDYFKQLANTLQTYINQNETVLKDDQRNDLFDKQIELLRIAGEINTAGIALVFEDVKSSIEQINNITKEVRKTVNKALIVHDAIELATSLVQIGTAILSKDTEAIFDNGGKAAGIIKAIQNKRKEMRK